MRLYVRDETRIMGPFCDRNRPKRSIQNYAPNVVEQSIEQLSNSTFFGDEIDLIVVKDDLSLGSEMKLSVKIFRNFSEFFLTLDEVIASNSSSSFRGS